MKTKFYSAFRNLMMVSFILFISSSMAYSQYCSPTFSFGCFSWYSSAVTLDAITWTGTSGNCSTSDFTSDTAYLYAGNSYPMSVTNGNWCGCGVWIDFNNDFAFDTTENLFHNYNGAQNFTYNFNINIPVTVPTGIYRMRVIAGWGSDTYTVGTSNGYGPCGSFQYGNFDDFSISVNNLSTGLMGSAQGDFIFIDATPNPAAELITVTVHDFKNINAYLFLTDAFGQLIKRVNIARDKESIDISSVSRGIYFLNYTDGVNSQSLKIVK